jgi:hypothetical protein
MPLLGVTAHGNPGRAFAVGLLSAAAHRFCLKISVAAEPGRADLNYCESLTLLPGNPDCDILSSPP